MQVTKYARDVRHIYQGDDEDSVNWVNKNNLVGDSEVPAVCELSLKSNAPTSLYLKDFDLDLPEHCRINSVKVEMKIGSYGYAKTYAPSVYLYWGRGDFTANSLWGANSQYISGGLEEYPHPQTIKEYDMTEDLVEHKKLTPSIVNESNFGVVLQFSRASMALANFNNINEGGAIQYNDAIVDDGRTIRLRVYWVRITVDYEEDSYALSFNGAGYSSEDLAKINPISSLNEYTTTLQCVHTSNYVGVDHTVNVDIPFGLELESYQTTNSSFNESTGEWVCKAGSNSTLTLKFTPTVLNIKELKCEGSQVGSRSIFYYVNFAPGSYHDRLIVLPSEFRKSIKGYFVFDWTYQSINGEGSLALFQTDGTTPLLFDSVEVDKTNTDDGVDIIEDTTNGNTIEVAGKSKTPNHIRLIVYYTPRVTGEQVLVVEDELESQEFSYFDYFVKDPFVYEFGFKNQSMTFSKCMLTTSVDTGAYILPCRVDPYDSLIVVKKPTLQGSLFKEKDYIGPVLLEQTHYSPKSTYSDKLLDEKYKNKEYMGKQGASSETITLNVRLHPQDVVTVQGLVDLDKPVPLNTNHKAFEGDPLNHRGWAELYGIKNVSKTNPHWYDTDIDVKYITHNINTRFEIVKGNQVSDYFLPNLLKTTYEAGGDFNEEFYVETTGNYLYSPSQLDYTRRNLFTLDEGEFVILRTKDPLSIKSYIEFNWDTQRISENKDNNISRIFRLVDKKTNIPVMEYEYYDIDYTDNNYYQCKVICRVYYKGAYKVVLNRSMVLHSDATYRNNTDNANDLIGSNLIFKILGNKLTIHDQGFTGKEIYLEDINLQNSEYYFEVEFHNNNGDMDTPPVMNFFDFTLKELDMSSEYSPYYKNLVVSPFPIPTKKIVFTRDSEEGTIYYLNDDGKEFSYLLEPFYQYYCGVNLETKDGISLMNLNNSFNVVYLSNGLVKLGINRLNGKMNLYKYDRSSKNYIHIKQLQLSKFNDLNLNSFSDDKIELQASDTIITMWRGRPYIQFKHETEDIYMGGTTTKIYGDVVGDASSEFPTEYSLIDNTNLLPSCIGSLDLLDIDCMEIVEHQVADRPIGDLDLYVNNTDNISVDIDEEFHIKIISASHTESPVFLLLDGDLYGEYEFDNEIIEHDPSTYGIQFDMNIHDEGEHTLQAIVPLATGFTYILSDIVTVEVGDHSYHLEPLFADSMYYYQQDFRVRLTHEGQPVPNKDITFLANGLSYGAKKTDSDGIATLNNTLQVGEYDIQMLYSYSDDENVLHEYTTSKTTNIKKGWVNINSDTLNINRHDYFEVTLTNMLDPDSDDIEESEIYVKGQSIVITVNGVAYPRITTSTGGARLQINLPAGFYDVNVMFAGSNNYKPNSRTFEINIIEE